MNGEPGAAVSQELQRRSLVWIGGLIVLVGGSAAVYLNHAPALVSPVPAMPLLARGTIVSRVPGVKVALQRVRIVPLVSPVPRLAGRGAAVSNQDGDFEFRGTWHGRGVLALERMADDPWTFRLSDPIDFPTTEPLTLELVEGASLSGRLLKAGQPLPGVQLIVIPADDGSTAGRVGLAAVSQTDAQGRFAFRHLLEDSSVYVSAKLGSLPDDAVIEPVLARTGSSGQAISLGDVEAVAGHCIAGRIIQDDGQSLLPGIVVDVSMYETLHGLGRIRCPVDKQGRFEARGLPTGVVSLFPHPDLAWGASPFPFHFADRMPGVDPSKPAQMIGKLERDVTGLIMALEPGPPIVRPSDAAKRELWKSQRLHGIESER